MALSPVIAPVVETFKGLVADGTVKREAWQKASSASGTSFLDAYNKSDNQQVKDIREESNSLTERLKALRDQARAILVEDGSITADAARVDQLRTESQQVRTAVKSMLDALTKSGLITDEAEIASLVKMAEPVLGKPRGRAAGSGDSSDSADDDTTADDSVTPDGEGSEDSDQ